MGARDIAREEEQDLEVWRPAHQALINIQALLQVSLGATDNLRSRQSPSNISRDSQTFLERLATPLRFHYDKPRSPLIRGPNPSRYVKNFLLAASFVANHPPIVD